MSESVSERGGGDGGRAAVGVRLLRLLDVRVDLDEGVGRAGGTDADRGALRRESHADGAFPPLGGLPFLQLVVERVEIPVAAAGLLDVRVKLDEGVGPRRRVDPPNTAGGRAYKR